ncbi:MAG: MATE family efflux transporter [Candidatus Fournierella pullistercoris]|uniref:MATE family efflux transporter n=1 Tax=Candidatus Allofournierella pullistercoris TaxID=2838597 RepID=A0A948T3V3_9FIRM|nr:MATE family efflux transporter [Candidatus Fournierella pullistercoris]
MSNRNPSISRKDEQKRTMILQGNLWKVLLYVGGPLAMFQSLNQIFKILDTMMAAHISPLSVSAVAYLSQINLMLSAIGGGLAVGSSIKVSEAYGAGDYQMVHRRVSTLLLICMGMGGCVMLLIPFTQPFLRLAGTPEAFIQEGARYFAVNLVDLVLIFLNTGYIAIERARGNAGRILWLNLVSIGVKLGLTAWFVYGLQAGVTSIAVATVCSDLVLTVACIWFLFVKGRGNVFGFELSAVRLNRQVTGPMLTVSLPVMAEKAAFQMGKVVVNAMATGYGDLTVGALGISNNLGGLTTNPQNGLQEAGAAIISQNRGADQLNRALGAFYRLAVICSVEGALGWWLTIHFLTPLVGLFDGGDPAFAQMIGDVYRFEAAGLVPLGLFSAVMALLYGFGYTKLTLLVNGARIFLFRIPVLWALQRFTDLGSESVGIVMMVSNISTGLLALVVGGWVIAQIKKQKKEEPYAYTRCTSA